MKKKSNIVDFERMKGRSMMEEGQEEDFEQEIEAEVGANIDRNEGETLEVAVKDWHPNKRNPASKVLEFADAKKHPRFQPDKETKEREARNAQESTTTNIKDDFRREKEVVLVDFGKMRGRDEGKEEDSNINEMVYGKIDSENALNLGEENAHNIAKGQSATKKRIPSGVSMGNQRGRNDLTTAETGGNPSHNPKAFEEEELVEQAADNRGKLNAPVPTREFKSSLANKGLVEWKKAPESEAESKRATELMHEVYGNEPEELDLEPKKNASSK